MQCLADGYFILPQTIGDGLQPLYRDKVSTDHPEFASKTRFVTASTGSCR